MPTACGAPVKYMWVDHDPIEVRLTPPILNQWYTVFDDEDVRLLWILYQQWNDETNPKDIELRWTIDGNVYQDGVLSLDSTWYWVAKSEFGTVLPGGSLIFSLTSINAARYVDKRGHSFKVEIRMVQAPGTNQTLEYHAIYETLEQVIP